MLKLNTTDKLDEVRYTAEKTKLCSEIQYPEYLQPKSVAVESLMSVRLKFDCRKVIVLITRFSVIIFSPKSNLKVISNATRFIRLSGSMMLLD